MDQITAGERFVETSGYLVVVGIFGAGFFSPDPPSHDAADEAVLAFYQQHTSGVLTGAFLWTVAMAALVLLAVALARACERKRLPETRLPLLPGQLAALFSVGAGTVFTVSNAIGGVAAVTSNRGATASTVRALDEISHLVSHLGTFPLGSFLLAAALAQLVTRASARWIAWLGIAAGAALVLTTSWITLRQHWIHDAGVIALLAFALWCLATSTSLLRSKPVPYSHETNS